MNITSRLRKQLGETEMTKMAKRRNYTRTLGIRHYRRLFLIATEGEKTEPQYFKALSNQQATIKIKCIKKEGDSSPKQVLKRMKRHLKEYELKKTDAAWLVVDKDEWPEAQLTQLHQWAEAADNRGLALSNPKFEYWLLLHFEEGKGIVGSRDCTKRLKKHLPDYNKGIKGNQFSRETITQAIQRAKRRDNPPCSDWPRFVGTTVYRLVENILQLEKSNTPD